MQLVNKTVNERIGELERERRMQKDLIDAHNEPIKKRIKDIEIEIGNLMIEDGAQELLFND
jgi:hypothetical protein